MVIINLFVAIAYESYMKFVSKPRQTKISNASKTEQKTSWRERIALVLDKYTAGNRKWVSLAPRIPRLKRVSVTVKRRSLHKMRDKISDYSLGETNPTFLYNNNAVKKDQDEIEDDLSGLSPDKRKEIIMKKRMQKKAEAKGRKGRNTGNKPTFVDVVQQYVAKNETEISLDPGQKVKVLDTNGDCYKGLIVNGKNAGKSGWFPAIAVSSFVSEINKAGRPSTLPKSESQPKFVKRQNADWTKDIIGPMTIMNPEELKELNKILKANARGNRGSSGSVDSISAAMKSPIKNLPIMNAVVEEEDEEEKKAPTPQTLDFAVPDVVIEQPSIIVDEQEDDETDTSRLHSPKTPSPESKAKERWRRSSNAASTEMPDWAKKFMNQANVKIATSTDIKSPSDEDSLDPLASGNLKSITATEPGRNLNIENYAVVHDVKQGPPVSSGSNEQSGTTVHGPKETQSESLKIVIPKRRGSAKSDLVIENPACKSELDSPIKNTKVIKKNVESPPTQASIDRDKDEVKRPSSTSTNTKNRKRSPLRRLRGDIAASGRNKIQPAESTPKENVSETEAKIEDFNNEL